MVPGSPAAARDRQTDERTNRQTDICRHASRKDLARFCDGGLMDSLYERVLYGLTASMYLASILTQKAATALPMYWRHDNHNVNTATKLSHIRRSRQTRKLQAVTAAAAV